jgi:hypothetical protein
VYAKGLILGIMLKVVVLDVVLDGVLHYFIFMSPAVPNILKHTGVLFINILLV